MVHKVFPIRNLMVYGVLAALLLTGCSQDADTDPIPADQQISQTEFSAVMNSDTWTGAADEALAELFQSSGSPTGKSAANDCYSAEYTETGFTATFNNCVLNGTDNINGTVVVTYTTGSESTSFTAVYDNFYVGTVAISGTRSYSVSTGGESTLILDVDSDMSVTLADGSSWSESGSRTFTFTFGGSLETTTYAIEGGWTLISEGNTYQATVTSALSGNFQCGYLTSGTLVLNKNGLSVSVDFGNGACDDTVVITYPNGQQEERSL